MARTKDKSSKVNPNSLRVMSLVDNAVAVAYSISRVKTPVYFVRDSVLSKLAGLLKHYADKSAQGVYYALGSIVNNGLTRRISPSVSDLDSKIEKACKVSGEWAGSALVLPFTLAFYLVASAYASAIPIAALMILSVKYTLHIVWEIFREAKEDIYNEVFLGTKKHAAAYKNMASKAAYMAFNIACKIPVYAVLVPVTELVVYALIKTLSLLHTPLAPVYMISSVFDLDNRFNIYNYEHNIGTIHGYILDIVENKHDGGYLTAPYAITRLRNEAVTGNTNSTYTVDTEAVPSVHLDGARLWNEAHRQRTV